MVNHVVDVVVVEVEVAVVVGVVEVVLDIGVNAVQVHNRADVVHRLGRVEVRGIVVFFCCSCSFIVSFVLIVFSLFDILIV